MIADEIGVTKAAVYHQYKTKDEIVLAAAESELRRLEAVIDVAENESSPRRARDSLIAGIVDLAIDRGRSASTILSDPVIVGFFADHDEFRDVMHRLRHILVGDDAAPEARVRTAMLIAAISGAVMHPFVADLDDDWYEPSSCAWHGVFLPCLPESGERHGVVATRLAVSAPAAGRRADGGSCRAHRTRRRSSS